MRQVSPKLLFFFFLLYGSLAKSQVKFYASISPDQISKNDVAQLRLVVENAKDIQEIIPPQLSDFIIVSGPNQESGMTMINGDVKKYTAVSFILKPKSYGNFTIPPATAKAGGKEWKSNPVSIRVNNTASANNSGNNAYMSPFGGIDPFEEVRPENTYQDYVLRKGENAVDKIKKNILVRVETNKKSCFVGEPIIATYKLYTRLKSESNLTKNPSFNGFSVIDLQQPDNVNSTIERLNGKEYNVYIIRRSQLYPLQPGNLDLEPAEIENKVRFIKESFAGRQGDVFKDLFPDFSELTIPAEGMEEHKVILQSNPMTILVKPLPVMNKPVDFKGAVGNFSIEASMAKTEFTTDDAGSITVIISGTGNLQLVTTPEIIFPGGIEAFDAISNDDLIKTSVPVSGRKVIEYPISVSVPGTYIIPPVTFTFFDPLKAEYKTIATKPIGFTVKKGTGAPPKKTVNENTSGEGSVLNKFFSNRWRVVSFIAMIIILGLIFWLRTEDKKARSHNKAVLAVEQKESEIRHAEDILPGRKNPFALTIANLGNEEGPVSYRLLNQAFNDYLSHRLDIPPEELNKKNISDKLDSKGIPNSVSLRLNSLMEEIDWKLYVPHQENEDMHRTWQDVNELVILLETYKI